MGAEWEVQESVQTRVVRVHQSLVHLHLGVEPRSAGEEATQDAEVRGGVVHHGRDGQELRGRGGGGGARERARASRRCATRRWEWAGGRSTNLDRRRRAPGRARRPIGRRGCRREGDGRRGRRRHPPGGASRRGPRTFARTARWGVDGGAIRVRGRRVRTRVAGRRGGDARASRGVRASPVRCGGGRGVRATREPAAVERRTPRRRRARHAAGNANRRHAAKRKRRHHREKVASRSGSAPSRRGQAVRRLGRRRRAARARVTAQESFRVRSALVCYSKEILALRSRLVASRPRA